MVRLTGFSSTARSIGNNALSSASNQLNHLDMAVHRDPPKVPRRKSSLHGISLLFYKLIVCVDKGPSNKRPPPGDVLKTSGIRKKVSSKA